LRWPSSRLVRSGWERDGCLKSIETKEKAALRTVAPAQDRAGIEEDRIEELGLPPSVQAALGELVNSAKEGLLALSVGVGLGALAELMEAEVDEVVGPKSKHHRIGSRCATGTGTAGSRSAAGACTCSARGSAPPTARPRCRWPPTRTRR
jgi:hypothetical protein